MDRIAKLKDFLQQNPHDNFLEHALALEYIKAGDETTARNLFETILQRDPSYIGSYYHLAQLLERNGLTSEAISWYEKGMVAAKNANDNHAFNELRVAWEELTL